MAGEEQGGDGDFLIGDLEGNDCGSMGDTATASSG